MSRSARLGIVAAAVALAGTACTGGIGLPSPPTVPAPVTSASSSSPPPTSTKLFGDTRISALAAASGRVEGLVGAGSRAVDLELEGAAGGGEQRARVTMADGRSAEVLSVGVGYWISGNEAFWAERAGSVAEADDLVGAYVPVDAAEATAVAPYTLRGLLSEAFARPDVSSLEEQGTPVAVDELAGAAAWVIGETGGPRLWVAADGSAELLRIVVPGADPLALSFSAWGRAESISAPAPGDIREE